jgi:hypothetical protein
MLRRPVGRNPAATELHFVCFFSTDGVPGWPPAACHYPVGMLAGGSCLGTSRPEGRHCPSFDPLPLARAAEASPHLRTRRRNAPAACASGGVPPRRSPPGSFRCLPAARRTITNTQCSGYRTAEPSDRPPWASRYERPAACPAASRDGPPRLTTAGPDWSRPAASEPDRASSVLPIAPDALLMVATAARRQGTSP